MLPVNLQLKCFWMDHPWMYRDILCMCNFCSPPFNTVHWLRFNSTISTISWQKSQTKLLYSTLTAQKWWFTGAKNKEKHYNIILLWIFQNIVKKYCSGAEILFHSEYNPVVTNLILVTIHKHQFSILTTSTIWSKSNTLPTKYQLTDEWNRQYMA